MITIPMRAPSGFLSPGEHAHAHRTVQDLDEAKEIVNRSLCHDSAQLSHEGRRILRNVWAYLHECFCAGGIRPNRKRSVVVREHAFEEYYLDPSYAPVPRERKWAKVRGVPTA
jgi:hypothetical protein